MASSPEPHFEEEKNRSYVKAYRSEFDVPDDKLVEAIEYLGRLPGGIVANRDHRKLNQAVEHIDNLRSRPIAVPGTPGVLKEYSYDELYIILVERNHYPMKDFEKLMKKFEDRFGYLPSPPEFVEFYEEKKGIDELEKEVKETNEALLESQVMLQGNQIALEQIQQALEQERRERQALKQEMQQALEQERQRGQSLEQELQRMREREEDQLEEEVRYMIKRVVCKVCFEKEVEVLFLPCYHLVSCQGCKEQLAQKKCPLCRAAYQGTIRVYFA